MLMTMQASMKMPIRVEDFNAFLSANASTISKRTCQKWMKNTVPFWWIHDGKRITNYRTSKTVHSIRRSSFKMHANLQNWTFGNTYAQKTVNPFANTWWKHQKNESAKNTWSQNHSICSWLSTSRSDFAEIHQNQPCQMMPIQSVFFIQNAICHKLRKPIQTHLKTTCQFIVFRCAAWQKAIFWHDIRHFEWKTSNGFGISKCNVFMKKAHLKKHQNDSMFSFKFYFWHNFSRQ